MFVDKVRITVCGGRGGDGAVAFHREKYVASGGPDGGDGGHGGSVILRVNDNLSTLLDFRYKRKYAAQAGVNGQGRKMSGKRGESLIVEVPRGTVVRDAATNQIIVDMSTGEDFVLAKGGRGGWGNAHYATPTRQVPRFARSGLKGQERDVILELKLLADVGLVGFPNVGKSTLLSVTSNARPKIANYHFTTLTPVLGVVKIAQERSFVMADIPGLIEGASEGVGLGHEFLRHVERCRLILHVLDVSGVEGRDPIEDYKIINRELANFSEELAECPQIVAANKADMATQEQIERLRTFIEGEGHHFFVISAATTQGIDALMQDVAGVLETLPPIKAYEPEPLTEEELAARSSGGFEVEVVDGVYYVDAKWVEPILRTVDMDDYSSLQYFQRVLQSSGIIEKLEEMGIQEGDTVNILGFEFDYVK